MCVCVRVPKNIPVKIKAKASWLTSSFLAAASAATNEKCCRHNLQHFLLFMFSSYPRASRARGDWAGQAHLALAHLSRKEEKGRQARPLHITMLVPMSVSMFGPTQVPRESEERIYGVHNIDITYTYICICMYM